jgi:hypothetical protein
MIQDTSRFVIGCRRLRVSNFIIRKFVVGKVASSGPDILIDGFTRRQRSILLTIHGQYSSNKEGNSSLSNVHKL